MSKDIVILHEGHAYNKDIIWMTIPLFLMAFFFYGPRVILLMLLAWATARLADRFAALLRARAYDRTDNSSVATAFLILLMLPATVRFRVVVVAVLAAVLLGREAFGGYGSYPFNPAAVGYCVAAVSWPGEVLRYIQPQSWLQNLRQGNATFFSVWQLDTSNLVEGPSYVLRNGSLPNISAWNLLLGNYAAPMGIAASLLILACGVYLVVRGRIRLYAPVCYVLVTVLIAFLFPRYTEISFAGFPGDWLLRLQVVLYETFSGVLLFSAVFMATEPVTLPKLPASQIIYGILLGVSAMVFRYFGTYEVGTCFAFLLVNAFSGYFDRAITRGIQTRKGAKRA